MICSIEIDMGDVYGKFLPRTTFHRQFGKLFPLMSEERFRLTGGCQCGAVRYALSEQPESTVCHCRMCQKAVGGPFAALSKVRLASFAWTRGQPESFRSSSTAERHFCAACGTPLTFRRLGGDAIEVTTGSLDTPAVAPPTKTFGVEARLPWIDRLQPGQLPDAPTAESSGAARVISRQHPDHTTPDDWMPPTVG
jgi:hypothetical protein